MTSTANRLNYLSARPFDVRAYGNVEPFTFISGELDTSYSSFVQYSGNDNFQLLYVGQSLGGILVAIGPDGQAIAFRGPLPAISDPADVQFQDSKFTLIGETDYLDEFSSLETKEIEPSAVPERVQNLMVGFVMAFMANATKSHWTFRSFLDVDRDSGWIQFIVEVRLDAPRKERSRIWSEISNALDADIQEWPEALQAYGEVVGISIRPSSD